MTLSNCIDEPVHFVPIRPIGWVATCFKDGSGVQCNGTLADGKPIGASGFYLFNGKAKIQVAVWASGQTQPTLGRSLTAVSPELPRRTRPPRPPLISFHSAS